jgi:L-histidine Nalpha-methyltransferase
MSVRTNDFGLTRPLFPRLGDLDARRHDRSRVLFRDDVIAGLSRPYKAIPPKYFYDTAGSALFERICEQPEYYPTRAELELLGSCAPEMAAMLGPDITLVELGSGASLKTRLLLDALDRPRAYVPVDISHSALAPAAARMHALYPGLQVVPVRADFTQNFALPPSVTRSRLALFFPGSTIGNLEPADAVLLMRKLRRRLAEGGWLMVGVDTKKPVPIIERAYNDAAGVTAAFNRNLLQRIRSELDADFDADAFSHRAFYEPTAGRIEMHLCSCRDHRATVDGHVFRFHRGETIHTENSYKYAPEEFAALAVLAGFKPARLWLARDGLFSIHGLEA